MRIAHLFLQYAEELRRYLRRYLNNYADIEEVAQETFLRVFRQELRGRLEDDARGYLFTTALNVARDKRRRERVRHQKFHVELSQVTEPMRSREKESDLQWKEGIRLVEAELQKVKPLTRAIFLMYHVEHLTFEEIANQLDITTKTVERHMVRALAHMKEAIGNISEIAND